MDALTPWADALISRLAWSSLQAALLFGAVGLLTRYRPRLPAAARAWLWWLLSLQLLLGLAMPLTLPITLPAPWPLEQTSPTRDLTRSPATPGLQRTEIITSVPLAVPSPTSAVVALPHWTLLLAAIWLLGVLLQAMQGLRQWRATRRLWHASRPLHDARLLTQLAQQADDLGLRSCPHLRQSALIDSPQVVGLWRPTVLLPASQKLTDDELSLALCHELVHLRRGDLYLGWLPALAQRLFFFHPLVHRAVREYGLQREAACDAQVLAHSDHSPQTYGRLLLRLGVHAPLASGLAHASPTYDNLKRRLSMLQNLTGETRTGPRGWLLLALITAIGVLPYRVSADAQTAPASIPAMLVPPAVAPTAIPPTPIAAPMPAMPPSPRTPPTPPANMTPSAAPAPPLEAVHQHDHSNGHQTDSIYIKFKDSDVVMSGSRGDLEVARRQQQGQPPVLWFRHGQQAYVIRDPAYLKRFDVIYAPAQTLANQQVELSDQQAQLSDRQADLAGRQVGLSARVADIGTQRVARQLDASASAAERQGRQADLQQQQQRIDADRQALAQQEHAIGQQQAALGKQLAVLGAQQRQASATSQRQLQALLDQAITQGAAEADR